MRSLAIRSRNLGDSELVAVEEEEDVSADDYTEEADDEDDLFLMGLLTVKTKNRRE
ncbi:MAG: hypothetical protein ACLR0U_32635 [Enterocloster clostridioformis]